MEIKIERWTDLECDGFDRETKSDLDRSIDLDRLIVIRRDRAIWTNLDRSGVM